MHSNHLSCCVLADSAPNPLPSRVTIVTLRCDARNTGLAFWCIPQHSPAMKRPAPAFDAIRFLRSGIDYAPFKRGSYDGLPPVSRAMIYPDPPDLEQTRSLSTDQLKALWDSWDGHSLQQGISGETIHRVLNERGQGLYCAV